MTDDFENQGFNLHHRPDLLRALALMLEERDISMAHKGEYLLRRIPPVLWSQVRRLADEEGHSIREVILRKLEEYVVTGFHQIERPVPASPARVCPVCAGPCDPAANGMSQIEHDAKLPEDWSQSV